MENNKILNSEIKKGSIGGSQAVILGSFIQARHEESYKFIEWAKYADTQLKMKNLSFFTEDDGKTKFTNSPSDWNVDLWKQLRIELEYDFSEKKLDYIVQVMQHLRKSGHPDFQVKCKQPVNNHNQTKPNVINKQLPIGAIAGAVVGAVIGVVIGRPIIGGALGAAIGGGIAHSISANKD